MENNKKDPKKSQNRRSVVLCLAVALGVFLIFSFMNKQVEKASNKEISYDQFIQMLNDNQVKEVQLTSDRIKIFPAAQRNNLYAVTYYTGIISMDYNLVDRLNSAGVKFSKEISDSSSGIMYMMCMTSKPCVSLWMDRTDTPGIQPAPLPALQCESRTNLVW